MIGIDIIKVKRFRGIKAGDFRFWSKFFNKSEWEHAFGHSSPRSALAGIFAAKEAVFKAYAMDNIKDMKSIEIRYSENGSPYARVKNIKSRIAVSISHDDDMAVAVALTK